MPAALWSESERELQIEQQAMRYVITMISREIAEKGSAELTPGVLSVMLVVARNMAKDAVAEAAASAEAAAKAAAVAAKARAAAEVRAAEVAAAKVAAELAAAKKKQEEAASRIRGLFVGRKARVEHDLAKQEVGEVYVRLEEASVLLKRLKDRFDEVGNPHTTRERTDTNESLKSATSHEDMHMHDAQNANDGFADDTTGTEAVDGELHNGILQGDTEAEKSRSRSSSMSTVDGYESAADAEEIEIVNAIAWAQLIHILQNKTKQQKKLKAAAEQQTLNVLEGLQGEVHNSSQDSVSRESEADRHFEEQRALEHALKEEADRHFATQNSKASRAAWTRLTHAVDTAGRVQTLARKINNNHKEQQTMNVLEGLQGEVHNSSKELAEMALQCSLDANDFEEHLGTQNVNEAKTIADRVSIPLGISSIAALALLTALFYASCVGRGIDTVSPVCNQIDVDAFREKIQPLYESGIEFKDLFDSHFKSFVTKFAEKSPDGLTDVKYHGTTNGTNMSENVSTTTTNQSQGSRSTSGGGDAILSENTMMTANGAANARTVATGAEINGNPNSTIARNVTRQAASDATSLTNNATTEQALQSAIDGTAGISVEQQSFWGGHATEVTNQTVEDALKEVETLTPAQIETFIGRIDRCSLNEAKNKINSELGVNDPNNLPENDKKLYENACAKLLTRHFDKLNGILNINKTGKNKKKPLFKSEIKVILAGELDEIFVGKRLGNYTEEETYTAVWSKICGHIGWTDGCGNINDIRKEIKEPLIQWIKDNLPPDFTSSNNLFSFGANIGMKAFNSVQSKQADVVPPRALTWRRTAPPCSV